MRFLKGCLLFLLADLALLLLLGGVAYYFLTRSPRLPAPPSTPSPQAAQALEDRLEAFAQDLEQASKAGQRKPMTLTITEAEASSLIDRELRQLPQDQTPFRVESAQVFFRDGKVTALVQIAMAGLKPTITVEARVTAQNGRPKVEVGKIDVGALPLPILGPIKDQITQALHTLENAEIPMEVEKVTVGEGRLTLEGWSKPGTG